MFKYGKSIFLRRPAFSIQDYNYFFRLNDNILNLFEKHKRSEELKKAILVASPDFFETLMQISMNDFGAIVNSKCEETLTKYLIRMTSRATPFGLFSGTNLLFFDEDNNSCISYSNQNVSDKVKISLDEPWIDRIKEQIVNKDEYLLNTKIGVNNSIYYFRNGYYDLLSSIEITYDYYSPKKIKMNELLEYIIQVTKRPKKVKNLLKLVVTKSSISDMASFNQTFLKFIRRLLNKNIISIVDFNLGDYSDLDNIMDIYNELKLDVNVTNILRLYNAQKSLVNSTGINVTYQYGKDMSTFISKKSLKQCEKLLDFLSKYIYLMPNGMKFIQYKNKFIEKYGYHRDVPFLELISMNFGLGLPNFKEDKFDKNTYTYEELYRVITNEILKGEEIDLKKIFASFNANIINDEKILSVELGLIGTEQSLENEEFPIWLAPIFGTAQSGNTRGRFINNDDVNINQISEEIEILKEHYNNSNYKLVLLSEAPVHKSLLNLESKYNYNLPKIKLGYTIDSSDIDINDLYVGVDTNNNWYVKDGEEKYLKFVSFNNINTSMLSLVQKMLLELTTDITPIHLLGLINAIVSQFDYSPRVKFENIIVFPNQWRIKLKDLKKNTFDDFSNFILEKFSHKSHIYLTQNDNRLLINLKNKTHLLIVYKQLKIKSYIYLSEVEDSILEALSENEIRYVYEAIIPFTKFSTKKEKGDLQLRKINRETILKNNNYRFSHPLGEWVYIRLYITINYDEFIKKYYSMIYSVFKEKYEVKRCFYIRYMDEFPHIRLRIKFESQILNDEYSEITEILNFIISKNDISKFTIDSFEREIERYGNIHTIDYFESVSTIDSKIAFEVLKLSNSKNIILHTIISILIWTRSMQIDYIDFENYKHKEFSKKFREEKERIIKFSENVFTNELICDLQLRNEITKDYLKKCNEKKHQIFRSLIHMHINRVLGMNQDFENYILFVVNKMLEFLKYNEKESLWWKNIK